MEALVRACSSTCTRCQLYSKSLGRTEMLCCCGSSAALTPTPNRLMGWGELPRAPANLYSCKKAIERITTSTTFSVKYRSINRLLIGAVIAAIYRLRWDHLPLTRGSLIQPGFLITALRSSESGKRTLKKPSLPMSRSQMVKFKKPEDLSSTA